MMNRSDDELYDQINSVDCEANLVCDDCNDSLHAVSAGGIMATSTHDQLNAPDTSVDVIQDHERASNTDSEDELNLEHGSCDGTTEVDCNDNIQSPSLFLEPAEISDVLTESRHEPISAENSPDMDVNIPTAAYENLLNQDVVDIDARCYYLVDEESGNDKESALPTLQWFPTVSSTQPGSTVESSGLPISGIASSDASTLPDRVEPPLYPVLATPVHDTISARLLRDNYPKFYERCTCQFRTKRSRRLCVALASLLLVSIVLCIALAVHYGKQQCSDVCYRDSASSLKRGWSPDLCPLAKCYADDRYEFMTYWQIWCQVHDPGHCTEFIIQPTNSVPSSP